MRTTACFLVGVALLLALSAEAQHLPPNNLNPADKPKDRLLEAMQSAKVSQLKPGMLQMGAVTIDQTAKKITMPGKINMTDGPIELIACAVGGRAHESILVLDVEPIHVQTGLLLIGLQPGQNITKEGDPTIPEGSAVIVDVTWEFNGIKSQYRAEDLALDISNKQTMPHTHWIFTGSQVVDGNFMAQTEKSIITTWRFPYTIIDNPLSTGTNDEQYVANTILLPPIGTPVTLIISAEVEKEIKDVK